MVLYFAEYIRENQRPLTDGEADLPVVPILKAPQRSIKAQRTRITL